MNASDQIIKLSKTMYDLVGDQIIKLMFLSRSIQSIKRNSNISYIHSMSKIGGVTFKRGGGGALEFTEARKKNGAMPTDDDECSSGGEDSDEDVPPKRSIVLRGGADDEADVEEEAESDIDDDDEDDDEDDDDEEEAEFDPETGEWKRVKPTTVEPFNADILGVVGTGRKGIFAGEDDLEEEESDEEHGEEEEDEDYFKKLDETLKHDVISDYHPEMMLDNADEIDAMSRVVRDADGIIVDPLHQTVPFLTKYERSTILGKRAEQIESGAIPMVHLEPHMIDSYLIAQKELLEKKIPFIVKRPLPNGKVEYWRLSDFEVLS
jgi:DNA-directed RNA polymerase I, II, and III subunit RPABC2